MGGCKMNDEFTVTHVTENGSQGGVVDFYKLFFCKSDTELEELSFDELSRLGRFLTDYCAAHKKEEVRHER